MSGLGVDKTWAKGSWETVIAQNPDYIIIADYGNSIRNDDDFQQKLKRSRLTLNFKISQPLKKVTSFV